MNEKIIGKIDKCMEELDGREGSICQDINAALMLRGAKNLLVEADNVRAGNAIAETSTKNTVSQPEATETT